MIFLPYYTWLHTPIKLWIEVVKFNILFIFSCNGKVFNILPGMLLVVIYLNALYVEKLPICYEKSHEKRYQVVTLNNEIIFKCWWAFDFLVCLW